MVIPDNDENGRNSETKLTVHEQTVENNVPKKDIPNNKKKTVSVLVPPKQQATLNKITI